MQAEIPVDLRDLYEGDDPMFDAWLAMVTDWVYRRKLEAIRTADAE